MNIGEGVQAPGFESALMQSVKALRRLAGYEMEPAIQERMNDLGERKEFLSVAEQAELISLSGFAEHRTIERLEAAAALKRLRHGGPNRGIPHRPHQAANRRWSNVAGESGVGLPTLQRS
jgi:hypothetical protein